MATPKKLVDRVDDGFATFAEWSIRMRWLIILTTLVLLCGGLYFAGKTRVDNSFDTFFNANDPSYVAYKEYLADFVSDEVIYIMYSAEETEHGPFDLEIMRTVAQLTGVLENEIPFAREATSLANVEFMRSVGEDDIEIDDLLIEFPETQQALLDIKTQVMAKPMYIDYLISRNAKYAAIIVQMERNSSDPIDKIIYDKEIGDVGANVYPTVSFNKLKEILARPEFANQGIQFYLSGDVPMNATYISILNDDMAYSIAGTLLVIVLVSMFLFRATLVGIVGPLSVVLLSVILTVGLLGLIGWPIGMFFSMVPTLICAVGVAQSVHILLEYQRQLAATGDRNESVKRALHKVGGPCLMAAVTTAVGFAVMTTSEMKALAEMGVYAPFGILISFFFSTTLLVVFLAGKPREKDESRRGEMAISPIVTAIVERAIAINTRYATAIILLSVAVFAVSFAGIANLRTDFNFLSEFKPSVTWRQHTEKIEAEMGGVLRMSYLIDTGVENGVKNPALIKRLG
ncbi:MAG: efflux RND transporter permease subunit, partial [Spongiibacteraceae bacterium]